jgi:hypothetical protein
MREKITQLLNDLKETRKYWKLKDEAVDRNVCRTRFGRGYGLVVRQDYRMSGTDKPIHFPQRM